MKVLLLVAVVALIHGSYGGYRSQTKTGNVGVIIKGLKSRTTTLLIKGPTQPVLEGERITLECLYSDSELNISQVHFEVFSQYMRSWRPVWEGLWCFYTMQVTRTAESLFLTIPRAQRYSVGPYRCVSESENATAPDNSSELLTFQVHYMDALSLSREGYSNYRGLLQEMRVRLGDDVVVKCSTSSSQEPTYFWSKDGGDWILPSSSLTLRKVSAEDEGQYTCSAEHPSVESLSQKRTISITVLPEDAPWYETTNSRLVLMTSAVAVCLLVFILSVSVFLCRRAKRIRTNKGPIDDHSQKKPIYKSSAESLPSTCGDKQPLV